MARASWAQNSESLAPAHSNCTVKGEISRDAKFIVEVQPGLENKVTSLSSCPVAVILMITSLALIIGEKLIAMRTGQIFSNLRCHPN